MKQLFLSKNDLSMKTTLTFLMVLMFSPLAFCQMEDINATSSELQMNRFLANTNTRQLYTFSNKYIGIEGSPYYSEYPLYGTIVTKNGTQFENVAFRYNLYDDVIEYNKAGEKINLFSEQISYFEFTDAATGEKRKFINGFDTNLETLSKNSFFEVLYNGQTPVLRRLTKVVMDLNTSPSTPGMNSSTERKKFSDIETEAYVVKRGKFTPVKLKRKGVLEAYSDQQKRIKTFIKSQLLTCRSFEDLILVTKQYDRILEGRKRRAEEKAAEQNGEESSQK